MITLICGLPNAGKTTYSENYENVIHFDDIEHRRPNEQFEKCNALAAEAQGDVCVEGVYNSVKRRKELLEAVKDKPGKRICVWISTSAEVCVKRENRNRPVGIVFAHAMSFQPPTTDEGWDEVIEICPPQRTEKE